MDSLKFLVVFTTDQIRALLLALARILLWLSYSWDLVPVCGICEVVSSTAFSGGSHGMARFVLGFYQCFLMAIAEVFKYCVYTSLSADSVNVACCICTTRMFHLRSGSLSIFLAHPLYLPEAKSIGVLLYRLVSLFALFVVCLLLCQ